MCNRKPSHGVKPGIYVNNEFDCPDDYILVEGDSCVLLWDDGSWSVRPLDEYTLKNIGEPVEEINYTFHRDLV